MRVRVPPGPLAQRNKAIGATATDRFSFLHRVPFVSTRRRLLISTLTDAASVSRTFGYLLSLRD